MQNLFQEISRLRAAAQAGQVETRFKLPKRTKIRGETLRKKLTKQVGMEIKYHTLLKLAIQRGLAEMEQEYINQINQENDTP